MIHKAGAGHPGGSLSAIDLIVGLYGTQLNVDSNNPDSNERDRFIMSKGHASPAVYAILKEHNFLNQSDLDACLLYTSPSPRDKRQSRMPSSA